MAEIWVRPVNGSDDNNGLSFANAKQTIQSAYTLGGTGGGTGAKGDIIYLVSESDLVVSSQINLFVNNTVTVPGRIIIGVNTNGDEDGTRFVIKADDLMGATAGALCRIPSYTVTDSNSNFIKNIKFDANGKFAAAVDNLSNFNHFQNCEFTGATGADGDGFIHSGTTFSLLTYCIAHNNSRHGIGARATRAYNCIAKNNGNTGFFVGEGFLISCVAHNNTSFGFDLTGASTPFFMYNCVADNNGSSGFRHRSANRGMGGVCSMCVSTRNGAWGYTTSSGSGTIVDCIFGTGSMANTSGSSSNVATYNLQGKEITYKDSSNGDYTITNIDSTQSFGGPDFPLYYYGLDPRGVEGPGSGSSIYFG